MPDGSAHDVGDFGQPGQAKQVGGARQVKVDLFGEKGKTDDDARCKFAHDSYGGGAVHVAQPRTP